MPDGAVRLPVVIAYPNRLIPPQGGGDVRTLALMEYLHASGFEVHLITRPHGRAETKALEARAYKVWYATPQVLPDESWHTVRSFARRARRYLKRRIGGRSEPESTMQRFRNPVFESWCFSIAWRIRPAAVLTSIAWNARILDRVPPDALRILDTIDVQHLRSERARGAGGDLDNRRCTREEEQRELERADILIAMQDEETEFLREMCPECTVTRAGHACQVLAAPLQTADTPTLMFAANLYDPNVRGIKAFLRDVWPRLRARVPEAKLLVCGTVCKGLSRPPAGVRLLGYVADLEWVYKTSAALINPIPYSTGQSVKVSEALARGRCVVASPAGVRGLDEFPDLPVDVTDSPEATVDALAQLLTEPEERTKRELAVWKWAREHLAPENIYKPIAEAIENRAKLIRP